MWRSLDTLQLLCSVIFHYLVDPCCDVTVEYAVGKVAPNSVVRVLPNCSHWVQQDAAEEVDMLMKTFFENPTKVL